MTKPIDDAALDTLFRTARTYNGYTAEPVGKQDIHAIYDLVKMGPTSANQQPGRFIWLLSAEGKDRLAECATGNNPEKIRAAPAAVVIAYDTEFHQHLPDFFPHVPDAKDWFAEPVGRERTAFLNTMLQAGYFIIAARALGFDTGPMTGFDNVKVDAAFLASTTYKSVMISTLGRGDPASIFPRLPRPDFTRFNEVF